MLKKEIRYGYNDVMIEPAELSSVEHRSQCNPFVNSDENKMLPIFTAPMSTVASVDNYKDFESNHITVIIPRNVDADTRKKCILDGKWTAVSLKEFEDWFCDDSIISKWGDNELKVLIDVANGHMAKILKLVEEAKKIYSTQIVIMAGNIANPNTYNDYCWSKVDYVRVGIGGGAGCITASNTAIYDGYASLLDDIYKIKKLRENNNLFTTKVIADGGIKNYSDVIKALALGADYVMIGSLFAKTTSCPGAMEYEVNGERHTFSHEFTHLSDWDGETWQIIDDGLFESPIRGKVFAEFYGMASKYGQIAINGKKTKTSEGIKKEFEVTTTVSTWVENMIAYLRSAMSYCDVYDVIDFNPDNVTVQVVSNNSMNAINK